MSKFIILAAVLTLAALLGLATAQSPPRNVDPAPKVVENVDLVKGLTVTGKLKQVIGHFSSHGWPQIGDTFEIDLDNLPKEKITLVPGRAGATSSMPFHAPMAITRVAQVKQMQGKRRTVIDLNAIDIHDKFVIRIIAEDLAKGSKVDITLDHPGDPLGSMAEAEGVIK
jgi:hypothetical protein